MQGQAVTCRGKTLFFPACSIHGKIDAGAIWGRAFRNLQGRRNAGADGNVHGEKDASLLLVPFTGRVMQCRCGAAGFRNVQGRSQAGPSIVCRGTAQQGLSVSCRGAGGQGLVNHILFHCRCVPNEAVWHSCVFMLINTLFASCTTDTCRESGIHVDFTKRWLTHFVQPSIMKAMRNK